MKVENLKLGQLVAVSIKLPIFYKARYLGYGDYGHPCGNVYCCQVYKPNGSSFIDFFQEVYDLENYNEKAEVEKETNPSEIKIEDDKLNDPQTQADIKFAQAYRYLYENNTANLSDPEQLISMAERRKEIIRTMPEIKVVKGISLTHEGRVGNCPYCGKFITERHNDIQCNFCDKYVTWKKEEDKE